ncbi:MAG: asparagine synthase C-terminal domain-containing protein [Sulfolobales archaeon]
MALSGGIDTSVILLASLTAGIKPRAYIAIYREGVPKDLVYTEYLAKIFNIDLRYVFIDPLQIERLKNEVIKCVGIDKLDSHGDGGCIEIRNDIVFYSVLEKAKRDGCKCVYTGSGGDEVFLGYSFLLNLTEEEIMKKIDSLINGRYPEIEIANCVGIKIVAPYLEEKILEIAKQIPIGCLRTVSMTGKEILREILASKDLYLISERRKTPAESGAGTISICRSKYDI